MIRAIIAGLIVGALAKFVMPGRDPGGIFITIILGIGGALLGTFLGRSLGFYAGNEGAGIIMSILGAIVLLAIYRAMKGRRALP